MRARYAITAVTLILLAVVEAAVAHDSWLFADRNVEAPGARLRFAFVTGEEFPRGSAVTDAARVARWMVRGAGDESTITAITPGDNALVAEQALMHEGVHVVAVALHANFIEIEPEHFAEYLAGEQADAALAYRHRANETDRPGTEMYTKLAKTFVEIGDAGDAGYLKPVGHALEIIPLTNPCRWAVGDEILVRVLLEGRPARGLRISSGHGEMPAHTFVEHAITDTDGVARFQWTGPGLWFLRTHVIRRIHVTEKGRWSESQQAAGAKADQRPDAANKADTTTLKKPSAAAERRKADWESYFATMTFRVRGD